MIPGALARNAVAVWGDEGVRWLADLPRVLAEAARDWDLTIGAPYELSYHHVAAVTCGAGTPAVLKLGPPGAGSLRAEVSALSAGLPPARRADPVRGVRRLPGGPR